MIAKSTFLLGFFVLVGSALQAQSDVLYYKFEAGAGKKAINYAAGSGIAPAEGTFKSTYPGGGSWALGKFGQGAMLGSHFDPKNPGTSNGAYYNYLNTGWIPKFTGSFTVAWFMKERSPQRTLNYVFSGVGSFRCFTNGVAGKGLWVRAWGGSPADLKLTYDIQAAARSKWVHVALVVDWTAKKATWYIDGKAQAPISLSAGANVNGNTPFKIGQHTTTSYSFNYDLDEFRFSTRAATPAEIMAWATKDLAASGKYGKGCGGTLSGTGVPNVGKPFLLDLTGPASSPFFLSLGLSRTKFGPLTLPFDLGTVIPGMSGCNWESSMLVVMAGALNSSGRGKTALPVPNNPIFVGTTLFNQALMVSSGNKLSTTNGLAAAIGY